MKLEFFGATLSKFGLPGSVLALLISTIPHAIGETNGPQRNSVYELKGHVTSFSEYSTETLEDGSGVVVWLVAARSGRMVRLNTELLHYRMIQRNRTFEPHLLVVPVGSIVEFPNHDPWFHNVFSAFRNGRFDLGVYEGGAQRAARFDRPGVSYLFCSLHSEMTAIVLTVDSTYFAVSDKTGNISIGNVPPGKYFLHVWYENATPQALEALRRTIFVGGDSRNLPTISIVLPKGIPMTGKNVKSDQSTFVDANGGRP
jgi:plastocyanin